jgi:hypothetical protein
VVNVTPLKMVYLDCCIVVELSVARMYQGAQYIIFKLTDFRYLINMLHLVQVRQAKYILARDDVRAYSIAALSASEFIELISLQLDSYNMISCWMNSKCHSYKNTSVMYRSKFDCYKTYVMYFVPINLVLV